MSSVLEMPTEEEDVCMANLRNKFSACVERNRHLEKENKALKLEILHLKTQITLLQAQDVDRSLQWKKQQSSTNNTTTLSHEKQPVHKNTGEEGLPRSQALHSSTDEERTPRVPRPPPPRPSTCLNSAQKEMGKESQFPPPPPPPPPPSKLLSKCTNSVRRVPEVLELYRATTRKEGKIDAKAGIVAVQVVANAREMIGEIENKSSYLLAIKSDVETKGEFINFLTREVANAAYRDISDVEAFVKWLDEELSYLVDERAVLKHFPNWPERKADAMREAAFGYRDLKNLESEVLSFHDDLRQPAAIALKRMRALQEKLECSVHNLERIRESASKRYRDFHIPWEWMLDAGIISQLKSGSMKLAKQYMNRVVATVQSESSAEDEELMLQGVRFAFRVHQFVGGFDEESRNAFQELRKLASNITIYS